MALLLSPDLVRSFCMPGPVPATVGTHYTPLPGTRQPDLWTRDDRRRQGGRAFGCDPVADCCAASSRTRHILSSCFSTGTWRQGATFLGSLRHGDTGCTQAALSDSQPRSDKVTPFHVRKPVCRCEEEVCRVLLGPSHFSDRRGSFYPPTATLPCFQGVCFGVIVGHAGAFPPDPLYSVALFRGSTPRFPCDPSFKCG